jgi:p-aminobenzoyl-glutamate transporter AbgT
MNLENDLKRALRRQSPPAGFAGRVMQRIDVEDRRSRLSGQARLPVLHWWRAAAASVVLVAALGGYTAHRIVEQRRGEYAKEQVLEAMRIASEKVRYAQEEARAIGSHD